MIFDTVWAYLYYIFLAFCCGYAIVRGTRTEYVGVSIIIVGSLSTLVVGQLVETTWTEMEVGIFVVDIVVLVALVWLAFKSDRFWPMWAAAFQLLAVTIHTAIMAAPQITPWAFATGAVFWAYPMLLVLAIGSNENVEVAPEYRIDSG